MKQAEAYQVICRALEGSGQRLTRQKLEVFHYVQKYGIHHPTAEEVYFGVKKSLPSISLATVYNCLEALVACKLLNRLALPATPSHYEMRGRRHDHFRCLVCEKIYDVETRLPVSQMQPPPAEFEVTDYHLLLAGYCPHCRKQRAKKE